MAGHVHHVVDPTEQPQVAVVVELRSVPCEIPTLEPAPVGIAGALGVAVDTAQHRRPRGGQREVAAPVLDPPALFVDDLGPDARKRERRRPRLGGGDPGQRGDHDGARLGLPPGVDHRAPSTADMGGVPHPCLGIDRLAHRAQQAQAGQVVSRRLLRAPLHEGPDGGRHAVEDGHAVALDDRPPAVPAGMVRGPLVHHRRRPVGQRSVDDVAVSGHPPDVGRAPVDVSRRRGGRTQRGGCTTPG